MGAMVRYKRETGKDVSELKVEDVTSLLLFLWCCVCSASKADGVQFDMSFEDFADFLEPQDVQNAINLFNDQDDEKKTRNQK